MTATTAADMTGAVTHTSISRLAEDGQVLVQVTTVPLAITKWILSRNSIALLGIIIASMEAQYLKKMRTRLDPWGER